MKKSLGLVKHDVEKKASILQNMGAIHLMLKNYDEAKDHFKQSLDLANVHNYNRTKISALINLGWIEKEQGNYDTAIDRYLTVLEFAKKNKYTDKMIEINNELMATYILQEDYKKAFETLKSSNFIKDSIREIQEIEKLKELEVKFKTAQKEKEIELLAFQNQNNTLALEKQKEFIRNLELEKSIETEQHRNKVLSFKNESDARKNKILILEKDKRLKEAKLSEQKKVKNIILIAAAIIMIPILILLWALYQKNKAQKSLNKNLKEINDQKVVSILQDQELQLIKARIEGQNNTRKKIAQELHDNLGGNLASAKLQLGMIEEFNPELYRSINQQLDIAYKQVRSFSNDLIAKNLSKATFYEQTKTYIENIGKAGQIKTSFSAFPLDQINAISEDLQSEIFRIVQELITNTLKHANADAIDFQIFFSDQQLHIIYEDDGIGFDTDVTSSGIGLRSIQERVQNIKGSWNIDSGKNLGTIVSIKILNEQTVAH